MHLPSPLVRSAWQRGLVLVAVLFVVPALSAQEKQPAEQGKSDAKSTAASPGSTKPADDAKPPVGDGERLSFDQAKAGAQMTELEERMFRLAEALKELEPENSSRLMIALKKAREELILHQMKETQELLKKLELSTALTEEKQILAKLQQLHELLLSMDLDFQMRLERLRLLREILRQLDAAIKEEDRELKLSTDAAELQKQIQELEQRLATLDELIKRQTEHVEHGSELAKVETADDPAKKRLAELGQNQDKTRGDTKSLAEADGKAGTASKHLEAAESQMGEAVESLAKEKPADALPRQQQALDELKKEKERTLAELKRREEQLARERFEQMRKDQEGNRKATDNVSQAVRGLGDSGATALGELIRAGGNMSSAEDQLGQQAAGPASGEQDKALKSLKYARDELARQEAELLEGLRAEIRRRVLEALTIMLEKQTAVRESTETLAPRVKDGSRDAVTSVVALSKHEERIIEVANEIVTLVEETEFGIALPAALRVVRHEMIGVKGSLAKGDASPPVVVEEKRIEEDLAALLDAMKQMPASSPPRDSRAQRGQRDRERELNRIIAELKMVRILQVRVNGETLAVDDDRPGEGESLSTVVRKAIAAVRDHQDDVRETTERLAVERGDDIQQ